MGMNYVQYPFIVGVFFKLDMSFKMGPFSNLQHTHPGIVELKSPPPPPRGCLLMTILGVVVVLVLGPGVWSSASKYLCLSAAALRSESRSVWGYEENNNTTPALPHVSAGCLGRFLKYIQPASRGHPP